jgi:hypothetical protein
MTDSTMYREGNRRLQDRFESRRIGDGLEALTRPDSGADWCRRVRPDWLRLAEAELSMGHFD